MNVNQILTAVGVVVAIAAVFVGQLAAYSALILVVLGLVSGFMSPTADMAGRMAYTVAAVAMPYGGQPTRRYTCDRCAIEQHYR
jgi:hypothetical protein